MKEKAKAKEGCLVCGDEATSPRGLCGRHYIQFVRKRKLLNEQAANAWEDQLVENGQLLPNRQGQRSDVAPDAFVDDFTAFVAKNPGSLKADEPTAREIASRSEEHTSELQSL